MYVDVTRNETAKVLYISDLVFQLLIVLEEILGCNCCLTMSNRIKRETHYTTRKHHDKQSHHDHHGSYNYYAFLCGHGLEPSGMKVEAPKIVDEWRIEEQAIETIKYATVSGQKFGGIF